MINEKKAISGIAVKNEHPASSSSIAVQQKTKFASEIHTVKRKYFLSDTETFTSLLLLLLLPPMIYRILIFLLKGLWYHMEKRKKCSLTFQD